MVFDFDPRWTVPTLSMIMTLAACSHPAPVETVPTLERAFRAAADETDVPRDLLAAMVFAESRLDGRGGEIDEHGQVGLMGLRTDDASDLGPRLSDAAEIAGVTVEAMTDDPALQVLGAAELLRSYAIEDLGEVPEHLQDWWVPVERFSGSDDPEVSAEYANAVFQVIEAGFVRRTIEGERVELVGRFVPGLLSYRDDRLATDYPGAAAFTPAATCNYTNASRASGIDKIVIHTVQGSYTSCINWFRDCDAQASAHYVVRSSDGQVTQLVDESDVAWHAGNWSTNQRSVGIELEGYIANPDAWYTEAMYRSAAALTRDIAARNGIPLDRSQIIGHNEVPDPDGSGYGGAGNHSDPGTGFDWNYFMALVGNSAPAEVSAQTGDLYGFVRAGDAETGAPLGGASVTLSDGRSTLTDNGGMYRFYQLEAGAWTVSARAGGYVDASLSATVRQDTIAWSSFGLVAASSNAPPPPPPPSTNGAPDAPNALGPSADQYDDAVRLAWTDRGAGSDLHEIEAWVRLDGEWVWYYTWTEGEPEKWFWPYRRDARYGYRVRGRNAAGWGSWSNWQEFEVH